MLIPAFACAKCNLSEVVHCRATSFCGLASCDGCELSVGQERLLEEARTASADAAGALAAEMDAMREEALAAALAEARASLAALQRQHDAGQSSLAELQALLQLFSISVLSLVNA